MALGLFKQEYKTEENILFWVIVVFIASEKLVEQTCAFSSFDWLPLSSAVCRLGNVRYLDSYMKTDFSRTDFHDGYYGIENFILKHSEIRVIKPFRDKNSVGR